MLKFSLDNYLLFSLGHGFLPPHALPSFTTPLYVLEDEGRGERIVTHPHYGLIALLTLFLPAVAQRVLSQDDGFLFGEEVVDRLRWKPTIHEAA